jgi:hypothetical protein
VEGAGSTPHATVAVDVRQGAYGRSARGSFHLNDPATRTVINTKDLGLLQVGDGWATFTGRATISGEPRSITVIIDQADPLRSGHASIVTVDAEGGYHFAGTLSQNAMKISIHR